MKTSIPIFVSVVALLSAGPARSADAEKTPQEVEALARQLVLKLGDRDFREREAASRELAKLGLGALTAVEEGRRSPDPEVRTRCRSLSPKIRALDLERRLGELAADKDGRIANTLPLGATYERICGKDENARKFYIEICKNHIQMLDYAASNPKITGDAFNGLTKQIENTGKGVSSPETEGAALLLIAADENLGPAIDEANRKQLKGGDRNYDRLIGLLWTPKYEALMTDDEYGRYFRKLLFAWAKRLPEPGTMQSIVFFIRDMIKKQVMNLEGGSDALEFLMDFAASTTAQRMPYQKGEAMSMLAGASISENERMAYFEGKLFKDETVVPQIFFKLVSTEKKKYEVRACDYALAICVKLSGQSLRDYGFDVLDPQSDTADDVWKYAGPMPDETRKAAFKKYQEWRKANPLKKA